MSSPFFPEVILAWKTASFIEGSQIPANEFLDAASKFVPIFGRFFTHRDSSMRVLNVCIRSTGLFTECR